jgi:regulator of nonsense transcripts 1
VAASLASRSIVLLGDHKQLPPVVTCEKAPGAITALGRSLLQRLAELKAPILLGTQYRMHPDLAAFANRHSYEMKMRNDVSTSMLTAASKCPQVWSHGHPLKFEHVGTQETKLEKRTISSRRARAPIARDAHVVQALSEHPNSTLNLGEANKVVSALVKLLSCKELETKNVRIITPYRAQQALIQSKLDQQNLREARRVIVGSVHSTQGGDADFVIISCVRSPSGMERMSAELRNSPRLTKWLKGNFGMLADNRLLNVCMTRARHGVIVYGNEHLLRLHEVIRWRALLNDFGLRACPRRKCITQVCSLVCRAGRPSWSMPRGVRKTREEGVPWRRKGRSSGNDRN